MEPFVKILYSECDAPEFRDGGIVSLGNANSLFEQRDFLCAENQTIENVVYEISYEVDSEMRTYCCSQNLGDGDGSVINHLRRETIDALEALDVFPVGDAVSAKSPGDILKTACKNMLHVVLPELEAYCLAYRANEIISASFVDNCHPRLLEATDEIIALVKSEPAVFIQMLEDVIATNPDNTGLIFAVENLIDKTEKFMHFVCQKDGEKGELVHILKEATQRASVINKKSIFYDMEPPFEKEESEGFLYD